MKGPQQKNQKIAFNWPWTANIPKGLLNLSSYPSLARKSSLFMIFLLKKNLAFSRRMSPLIGMCLWCSCINHGYSASSTLGYLPVLIVCWSSGLPVTVFMKLSIFVKFVVVSSIAAHPTWYSLAKLFCYAPQSRFFFFIISHFSLKLKVLCLRFSSWDIICNQPTHHVITNTLHTINSSSQKKHSTTIL